MMLLRLSKPGLGGGWEGRQHRRFLGTTSTSAAFAYVNALA
jgi:hypothetical protein